jgi:hypothetical protein
MCYQTTIKTPLSLSSRLPTLEKKAAPEESSEKG